ncbi:polyprenol phosphomannose-dependent alpha 1,6 mannosyltransferase MptB [Vallicoccus soli]|uniref:DUF2029 domain-containing protein n=1 Tax=Vallicoccus soli TaxID=2339232 RepID=A0A3A3ZHM4_9ACTN|nr:polyprenol phosphomannose-dependent alpha 1,6 mannosyltransferase MptB [Vallicoccus soli]RJK94840.1 hypothetical protein D5H78_13605 [Vallicoccus soli]
MAPPPGDPHGGGRRRTGGGAALALVGLSVLLTAAVGLLGPSVAVPDPGPGAFPLHLAADPHPWLVTALHAGAVGTGAAGLALALRALRRGWRPDPRRLLAAGALAAAALALLPPLGSADHLSYAAYGRIAAQGGDPYADPPDAWRGGTDPVASAVEEPWRATTSVYGPVATAEQALASALGGAGLGATVTWLALLNAAAVVGAGVVLLRTARRDPVRRARAVLLWALNPLVLLLVVAGAHVDGLAVALGVAGLAALRRSPLLAGALLGAAAGTKASTLLLALAAAWAVRAAPRDLARLAAGGALVLLPAYALAGPHALDQLRAASRYVSLGSPWHLLEGTLDGALGSELSRPLIGLGAWALTALVALALARLVPAPPAADRVQSAARAGALLCGAWVLCAPYSLPWYDAALWAPLALLPASALDLVALLRTTGAALAYVPGRSVPGDAVHDAVLAWRSVVTPWLGLALLLLVLHLALRRPGRPGRPGRPALPGRQSGERPRPPARAR